MKRRRARGYRLPRGQKKIVYFNGYEMRNLYPDLDIMAIKGSYPNIPIPEGELWIDERYKDEWEFLSEVSRIEDEKVRLGWDHWRIRRYLKTHLTKKGPKPEFIVNSEKRGGFTINSVRGDIVRQWDDPFFYLGGHGRVYPYIPRKNEVWIDIKQDPREVEETISHETDEGTGMKHGLGYNKAHRLTTIEEHKRRILTFVVGEEQGQRDTAGNRRQRFELLRMEPCKQSFGYCGPASLKIYLSYFGKRYSQKRLGKLCSCTVEEGTYHSGMVEGARAIKGASVHTIVGASLDVLRRFLWQERLPVIVGWFLPEDPKNPKLDEDHYSVVYRITPRCIYLMDPELKSGKRRLSIRQFLKNWWDIDEGNKRVRRWCMVINFDNQTFDTPRGVNY